MDLSTVLIISFFVVSIFGTLLHFTHDWFKKGVLLHLFSAINESTWEHMKLLLAPTLLVLVFQFFVLRFEYDNLFNGLLSFFFVEIFLLPLLYEPLHLVLKNVPLPITICIFYVSILGGLLVEYFVLQNGIVLLSEWASVSLIVILGCLFCLFTYRPLKMFLFRDPVTGRYGDLD